VIPLLDKIDILGFPFEVVTCSKKKLNDLLGKPEGGKARFGCIAQKEGRIYIWKDLPLCYQWETLLHEIGHQIVDVVDIDLDAGQCDLTSEPILSLYHRLYTGVLMTNGIFG
jgi:hypothetical protein